MGYKKVYELWKTNPCFDENDRKELAGLTDEKEIEERFYKELEFGTGGLRGILGIGSNRINKYNIRKATTGFGRFLLEKFGEEAKKRGIAVAYDCRNFSKEFAMETALTMCALGIKAYLYDQLSATPLLSYTVRDLGCVGGVVITASHNPAEYNGYKAYDETGCQLLPEDADAVIAKVNAVDVTKAAAMDKEAAFKAGLLNIIGDAEIEKYLKEVEKQASDIGSQAKEALKIVYTPLHGAGNVPVRKVLAHQGYANVSVVEEQTVVDGNFPTVKSPNPEEKSALSMGIELAEKLDADIVLATDPDSDREGIAVKDGNDYVLFSGNQTGALVMDYVLSANISGFTDKSTVIKTIVTGELGGDVARSYGLNVTNVLTGFKYIGGLMNKFERDGSGKFEFGYEESYGMLIGEHARDKDAVVAAMKICEMAAYYKSIGVSLTGKLNELYGKFGFYLDKVDSYTFKGKEGAEKMKSVMEELRTIGSSLDPDIIEVKDYSAGIDGLPKSDVLKYIFTDGSWMAIRPSGTEPKIKIYYSIKSDSHEAAAARYEKYKAVMDYKLK